MNIVTLIPCKNEEQTIGEVVIKAKKFGDVVVINNNSNDKTEEVAKESGAEVIKIHYGGYGEAYRYGIKYLSKIDKNFNIVVMVDGDGTYNLNEIPRFIEQIKLGYDVVVGSRFKGNIERGAMPFLHRYLGSPLFTWLMGIRHGLYLTEPSTGFVAYKRDKICISELTCMGFAFASEFLITAHKKGLKIIEIPIDLKKRKKGSKSKINLITDGISHIIEILK